MYIEYNVTKNLKSSFILGYIKDKLIRYPNNIEKIINTKLIIDPFC